MRDNSSLAGSIRYHHPQAPRPTGIPRQGPGVEPLLAEYSHIPADGFPLTPVGRGLGGVLPSTQHDTLLLPGHVSSFTRFADTPEAPPLSVVPCEPDMVQVMTELTAGVKKTEQRVLGEFSSWGAGWGARGLR